MPITNKNMTNQELDKELTSIKTLAEMMLEKCSRIEKERGLVPTPAPQKGLTREQLAKIREKRNLVIKRRKYE